MLTERSANGLRGSVCSVAKVFLVLAAVASSVAQDAYIVGHNVRISVDRPGVQYYETQIAADPHDARHLVACAYAVHANKSIDDVYFVSFDRGATWQETLTIAVGVDPSCVIDGRGNVLASAIHDVPRGDGEMDSTLALYRSTDAGRTFTRSTVAVDSRRIDRAYLTVDDARGRVYVDAYFQDVHGLGGGVFTLYTSADGGRSFTHAISRLGDAATPKFVPANGVVTPGGAYVALTAVLDATKLNMFKGRSDEKSAPDLDGVLGVLQSTDGGATLDPIHKIADVYYDWRVPQLSMASLAVDSTSGPFRGRLYAVWPDGRLARRTQIFLSSSSDGGRTWTDPRVVSDDAGALTPGDRPNHFMPMVAVNKDGVVGVSWYDRRDNPDNIGYWPRFAASLDGGTTWLSSVRLSTSPNAADPKETRLNSGDTAGLTADADGVFHAAWIDNRTGTHQMWTTTIRVNGSPRRPTQLDPK